MASATMLLAPPQTSEPSKLKLIESSSKTNVNKSRGETVRTNTEGRKSSPEESEKFGRRSDTELDDTPETTTERCSPSESQNKTCERVSHSPGNLSLCVQEDLSKNNKTISKGHSSDEEKSEEYFKPLKKLKMLQREEIFKKESNKKVSPCGTPTSVAVAVQGSLEERVANPSVPTIPKLKSFSILDILNHSRASSSSTSPTTQIPKIVRPWDPDDRKLPSSDISSNRPHFPTLTGLGSPSANSMMASDDKMSLDQDDPTSDCDDDMSVSSEECSSRSTSSDIVSNKTRDGNPLDALFQMTSKTFDNLESAANSGGLANHANFNGKFGNKKKRKSRTAFTNHQIFGLEKRFLYQKYLSPADRDEIALTLGLSNAQVITWFQNRRAKLKRDMEELKKEAHSATLLGDHSAFIKTITHMGLLKTKTSDLFFRK